MILLEGSQATVTTSTQAGRGTQAQLTQAGPGPGRLALGVSDSDSGWHPGRHGGRPEALRLGVRGPRTECLSGHRDVQVPGEPEPSLTAGDRDNLGPGDEWGSWGSGPSDGPTRRCEFSVLITMNLHLVIIE